MLSGPIRLLIVDDHRLFRQGLRALLETVPDVELVGEAGSGEEAVTLVTSLRPDVVLMDITMPDEAGDGGRPLSGIAATRRILDLRPETRVVMLTMRGDDDALLAAMRAGARGYVLKGADEDELLRVVRAAAQGEALFGPAIAQRLIRFFGNAPATAPGQPGAGKFAELSEREHEVLDLIAQGLSNTAIAERLVLSPKTVRNHISNIFDKLQVTDRANAIVRAREAGMGLP